MPEKSISISCNMSCTTDKYKLLKYLKTFDSSEERRCCMMIYLCRTVGPYFINISTNIKTFQNLKIKHPYLNENQQLPQYNNKYKIFTVLMSYIQQRRGVIDHIVKYQLASDCQNEYDLNEFTYHLYKEPPDDKFIIDLLSDYEEMFTDNFFQEQCKQIRSRINDNSGDFIILSNCFQQMIANKNKNYENITHPMSICNQYIVNFIYGCNKERNKFYVLDKLNDDLSKLKTITIANVLNHKDILNELQDYISDCFIVNRKKSKVPFFILHPDLKPIAVFVYNNFIIKIV